MNSDDSSDGSSQNSVDVAAVRWSAVRRRAICRASIAGFLALISTLWPLGSYFVNETCGGTSLEPWSYAVLVYTTVMTLLCFRLVYISEMTWWLSSPFLNLLRGHILLDAVNVWLLHISTHPLCDYDWPLSMAIFRWLCVACQLFFWLNKFVGFYIITTHLVMLERAFDRSLGTRFLKYLFLPFGGSLVIASVFLFLFHLIGDLPGLIIGVVAIEAYVVASAVFVAVLFMRGFLLTSRSARRATFGSGAAQKELICKALCFSKRMVWETPLNLCLVAAAFSCHINWLLNDHGPFANVLGDSDFPEVLYTVVAITSLTNCARFGSLLSLVEVSETATQRVYRTASMLLTMHSDARSDEAWSTGHEVWDDATAQLAARAISLGALLDFYHSLPERMPHFDPAKHTTEDVVRQAIIPMSCGSEAHGDSAAALLLMQEAVMPDRMVTHSWSNLFTCLVAAVVADALGLPSYEKVLRDQRLAAGELRALKCELHWKKKLETKYWICCFAVNQHAGICGTPAKPDPVTGLTPAPCRCKHPKYWSDTPPLRAGQSVHCEMNKFDDMMSCIHASNPRFSQLIAVDTGFKLFTRAWCVAEIHRAREMGMSQRMSIFSERNLKEHEGWLQLLQVETMRASNPADTQLILDKIDDKQRFNSELQSLIFDANGLIQACHEGFDKVALLGTIAQQGAAKRGRGATSASEHPAGGA